MNNSNEKIAIYDNLMNIYINTICDLLDTSKSMGILPFKISLSIYWIKNYITENRFEVLENGIIYLLTNKETILNFNLSNLDILDFDIDDDNKSIKSCLNNMSKSTKVDDLINTIIEIKNNVKKKSSDEIEIIKKYFEILILILEKIENLFK